MVMTEIELKRSVGLMVLQLAMGVLAGVAIGLADMSRLIKLTLAICLFGALVWAVWQWRRPMPGLRIKADGQLQLDEGSDGWQYVDLLPGSFVSTGLSVVSLRTSKATYRLVLLPDSARADALRRLRLSLRWARRTRSDIASPDAG